MPNRFTIMYTKCMFTLRFPQRKRPRLIRPRPAQGLLSPPYAAPPPRGANLVLRLPPPCPRARPLPRHCAPLLLRSAAPALRICAPLIPLPFRALPALRLRSPRPPPARPTPLRSLARPTPPSSPRLAPPALAQARPPAPPRPTRSPASPCLATSRPPPRRVRPARARSPAPPGPPRSAPPALARSTQPSLAQARSLRPAWLGQ